MTTGAVTARTSLKPYRSCQMHCLQHAQSVGRKRYASRLAHPLLDWPEAVGMRPTSRRVTRRIWRAMAKRKIVQVRSQPPEKGRVALRRPLRVPLGHLARGKSPQVSQVVRLHNNGRLNPCKGMVKIVCEHITAAWLVNRISTIR